MMSFFCRCFGRNVLCSVVESCFVPAVDITLDPDTANPWLQLSQDRHQVRHLGAWQELPDHPDRFDTVVIVLGRDGFTSGRHYWEVQVGDKDDWYLGVAKSSVKRKGRISVSTAQGYWALAMKKGQVLHLSPRPRHVGVYLDYEAGRVSFFDVTQKLHIYSFLQDRVSTFSICKGLHVPLHMQAL
uniref:B30.2/SPRY domain-containing protein n=1 Tax=Poecilia mexicana TaxID=48701 RepID=A0A3B3YG20_9TELE